MNARLEYKVHALTGESMVEVFDGEQFIACIYPTERGIRLISKFAISGGDDPGGPPFAFRLQVGRA